MKYTLEAPKINAEEDDQEISNNDEILEIEEQLIKAKIQQLKILKQKKLNNLKLSKKQVVAHEDTETQPEPSVVSLGKKSTGVQTVKSPPY